MKSAFFNGGEMRGEEGGCCCRGLFEKNMTNDAQRFERILNIKLYIDVKATLKILNR